MPCAKDQVMLETIVVLRTRCLCGAWNTTLESTCPLSRATLPDTNLRVCFFRFFRFESVLLTFINCGSRLYRIFFISLPFFEAYSAPPVLLIKKPLPSLRRHHIDRQLSRWLSSGSRPFSHKTHFVQSKQMADRS